MPEKRKPCRPYQLNTIGVCLFGRPYFPEEQDVCPRKWYNDVFEGKTDSWLTDTSFDHLQSQVEDYLRDVFPRLNTAKITLNWALLIGAFVLGIVPGLFGLFIIFLRGDKSRVALKEMCKRAFDLEILERQLDVPPEGREVDIVAHHLVCSYFQTFQKDSWTLMSPIRWFTKFLEHQDVPKFCSKQTGLIMEEYELWNDHTQLEPAATMKAVEMLSRPRVGGSTRYVLAFVIILGLFIVSVVLSIVLDNNPPEQPEVSLAVGCTVIALYLIGSFLYLWTWMPVARRIAGLVRPSTERWTAGSISRDPIHSVTDLAMLSILQTELRKERVYIPGMMYWHNVAPALSSERSKASRAASRASLLSAAHVRLLVTFFSKFVRGSRTSSRTGWMHCLWVEIDTCI